MLINLITIGKKMSPWIISGYQEYAKRLPISFRLNLIEIAAIERIKGIEESRILQQESERMLAAIPKHNDVIALDIKGQSWSTLEFADQLKKWIEKGKDMSLLVGGPEGLAPDCLKRANQKWSLSPLTFPHPLVRVIVAEQIYRAWSILNRHPYHRK